MAEKPDKKLSTREVTKEDFLDFINRELVPLVEKMRLCLGQTIDRFQSGIGSPEGVVTAEPASLYQRTDGAPGTLIYRKDSGSGNTGWTAIA